MVAASKAKVVELVGAEVERLDLSKLPIHHLSVSLSRLAEGGVDGSVLPDPLPDAQATIQAFVKFGRNGSAANRRALESAGLHWHGRDGGWTGNVTPAALAHLRKVFGKRVEKPECEDGGLPATPLETAPGAVSNDVEAIVTPVEEERGQADTVAEEPSVSTATTNLRFGFPPRPA